MNKIAKDLTVLAKSLIADGPRDMLGDFADTMKIFWKKVAPAVTSELKKAGVKTRANILRPAVEGQTLFSALYIDLKGGGSSHRIELHWDTRKGIVTLKGDESFKDLKIVRDVESLDGIIDLIAVAKKEFTDDAGNKVKAINEWKENQRQRQVEEDQRRKERDEQLERERAEKEGKVPTATWQTYIDQVLDKTFDLVGREYRIKKIDNRFQKERNGSGEATVFLEDGDGQFYARVIISASGVSFVTQLGSPTKEYEWKGDEGLSGNINADAKTIAKDILYRAANPEASY